MTQDSGRARLLATIPLDVLAAGFGSVTGAVIGVHHRFVLMGVIGLAIISGVGGGLVRDTLLQQGTPVALQGWSYGAAVLAGGLVGAFFAQATQRFWRLLLLADSVALGLFAALGAEASLALGLPAGSALAVGTTAAVGGWAIRDVLTGVIPPPDLFKPGDLHGAAALVGCSLYVLLVAAAGVPSLASATACVLVTFVLRWAALSVHLREPRPHDYSPHWIRARHDVP